MESSEEKERASWLKIRRLQVIGLIIGALGSSGFMLWACNAPPEPSGGNPAITYPALLQILICLPMEIIFQLLGISSLINPPPSGSAYPSTPIKFIITNVVFVGLINGALFFCLGTAVGWFLNKKKRSRI